MFPPIVTHGLMLSCLVVTSIQQSVAISSVTGNDCDDPVQLSNGGWSLKQDPKTVSYTCNPGYKLDGPSKQLCLNNGTWDPPQSPVCTEFPVCDKPYPVNGKMKYTYGTVFGAGAVITVECDDQYAMMVDNHLLRELQLTCSQDGQWVTQDGWRVKPECTIQLCDSPPDVPHSQIRFENMNMPITSYSPLSEGETVLYTCDNGYTLANPQARQLICSQGEWNGNVPSCVLYGECSPPAQIQFGRYFNDDSDDKIGDPYSYRVATSVTYICDEGYKLVGASTLVCTMGQEWSHHPPQCVPGNDQTKYCPSVSTISNGHCFCESQSDLQYCEPFYQGLHVECVCNDGFKLIGESIVTCGTSGRWDYLMPSCVHDVEIDGTQVPASNDQPYMSTLAIVIATACSVLGVLLLVMVIMLFRRRKPHAPRLCRPSSVPPPYSRVHSNSMDEHDRMLLIGYDNAQVALPTYDEATQGSGHHGLHRHIQPSQVGEYRQLPSIPNNFRSSQLQNGETSSRHSIVTTSTMNRDGVSELFGSIDTVNVSMSDASTAVTVETFDSTSTHHSNSSQRARAGSINSSNGSLVPEDAPLLDNSNRNGEADSVSNQEEMHDKHEN